MSAKLKALLAIKFKKRRKKKENKLMIKADSSSSDDEKFKHYNYAQKVQNVQIRDNHNYLESIFFQRSQTKSFNHK